MMVDNPEKVDLIANNHVSWQIKRIRGGWSLGKVLGAKEWVVQDEAMTAKEG